jgi:ribosomal-protein-serine acetyltransferase
MSKVENIRIRPYQPGDATALYEAVRESMAELQPFMPWCHAAYSIDEARTWAEAQTENFRSGKEYNFVITCDTHDFAGACGLNRIDVLDRHANLGYWVRTAAARKGVATEAVRLLVEWAFRNTELIRLEVSASTKNLASLRVAEKAGAIREGVLRSRLLLYGAPHDAVMFAFIRPGFTADCR